MLTQSAIIGKLGEQKACLWLHRNGYMIRELNWRAGRYELDIIAEKFGKIHFVEVKSRKAGSMTRPEEAMTKNKCDSLIKAARVYLAQYRVDQEYQFDLMAIDVNPDSSVEIRLIERVIEFRW